MQEPSAMPSDDLLPSWLQQNLWLFSVHDLYSLSSLNLLIALLFSTWNPADFPHRAVPWNTPFHKSKTVKIKDESWLFSSLQNNKLSLGGFKTSVFTAQNTRGSKQAEMVFSKVKWDQNQDRKTWNRISYSEIGVVGIPETWPRLSHWRGCRNEISFSFPSISMYELFF